MPRHEAQCPYSCPVSAVRSRSRRSGAQRRRALTGKSTPVSSLAMGEKGEKADHSEGLSKIKQGTPYKPFAHLKSCDYTASFTQESSKLCHALADR